MAWHVVNTESRYYLPSLGCRPGRMHRLADRAFEATAGR
jgi:hypothetical protein